MLATHKVATHTLYKFYLKCTMTRLGLGTIEGPMWHLPPELIKHIITVDLAKRLKRINRWVNNWIEDL